MELSFEKSLQVAERKAAQIGLLEKFLGEILPDHETLNPFEDLLDEKFTGTQRLYLPLVLQTIKRLTVLYRHNREELKKNYWESCMEDVAAVLGMLQSNLSPLSLVKTATLDVYLKMKESREDVFTARRAMELTGWSKTHIHRILKELLEYGLLERGGSKNRGYYYRLK